MIELDAMMADPGPAELGFFQPLRIEANAGAIPPHDLDSVCSLGPKDIKCTVERITASIPYQRKQAVRPLSEVDGMARKKDLHPGRDHSHPTARIPRCRCASPISASARITTSPMISSIIARVPIVPVSV